jgi:hypothetical protein
MAANEQMETPSGGEPPGGAGPATPNSFEWGHYGSGQVHLFGLLFCIGSIVLLTRLSSLLSPFNLYFTFSDLITSSRGTPNPFPFLIKAGIPFLTGMMLYGLYRRRDSALVGVLEANGINLELTAQTGAGLGALLMAWPAIVLWEFVVSDAVLALRFQFILVYALYVASFAYLASTGVTLSRLFRTQRLSLPDLPTQLRTQYQLAVAARSLIIALGTGGVAEWASAHLSPFTR